MPSVQPLYIPRLFHCKAWEKAVCGLAGLGWGEAG